MKTRWLVSGSFILGLAIGAVCIDQIKNAENEPISSVPTLDYFIADESFSEVHNAKAVLAGLSRRFLTELRGSAWIETDKNLTKPDNPGRSLSAASGLILALERGIDEFRGTEHEFALIADLLRAFKSNKLHDRWLQTYLAALYTHPTDELVRTFARDAVQIGRRAGRQEEVANALRHVCSIPMEFPGKADLQSTALKLLPRPDLVQNGQPLNGGMTPKSENVCIVQ